jgi:hypothetical protein
MRQPSPHRSLRSLRVMPATACPATGPRMARHPATEYTTDPGRRLALLDDLDLASAFRSITAASYASTSDFGVERVDGVVLRQRRFGVSADPAIGEECVERHHGLLQSGTVKFATHDDKWLLLANDLRIEEVCSHCTTVPRSPAVSATLRQRRGQVGGHPFGVPNNSLAQE